MLALNRRLFSVQTNGNSFNIGRLNHIAIAYKDTAKVAQFFKDVLNMDVSEKKPMPEHGVSTTFVNFGNTKVELLEPLGDKSPIAAYLEKNPRGGFHHFCYDVDNLDEVVSKLKEKGIAPLAPPKTGAHGLPVIFVHPKDCHGVLTEFQEDKGLAK